MRFLAAGRSFMGIRDGNSPYRMAPRSWLGAVRALCGPGAGTLSGAEASAGAGPVPFRPVSSGGGVRREVAEAGGGGSSPAVGGESGRIELGMAAPEVWGRPGAGVSSRVVVSSPDRGLRSLTHKARRPLVQGELALESIQVVRNDLSDAEVELVPARGGGARTLMLPGFAGVLAGRLTGGWVSSGRHSA